MLNNFVWHKYSRYPDDPESLFLHHNNFIFYIAKIDFVFDKYESTISLSSDLSCIISDQDLEILKLKTEISALNLLDEYLNRD